MLKKIYLASDHAGFEHKEETRSILKNIFPEIEVIDCGPENYNPDDDYPDFIKKAAEKISKEPQNKAIIFGGSGQGEAIVANRFSNVRAVVYYGFENEILKLSREHNDANILSIGARFVERKYLENILNI
jgi:ribose 5-phosphate isomerase B